MNPRASDGSESFAILEEILARRMFTPINPPTTEL